MWNVAQMNVPYQYSHHLRQMIRVEFRGLFHVDLKVLNRCSITDRGEEKWTILNERKWKNENQRICR